ncbi:hypothetical protein AMTRI_Chr03g148710 [Amborella trichopoda]|uniref:Bifunctional inhibitor/plant lipid transfer protein/seed storage helical domain-containing protein n=1 Tax=Amborella trichopoda TaxID=13333 RepID=W1P1Y9_AMBTC|nr:hypothetical protein AMTR_s00002p00272100 [Amborella trichopoda]
MMNRFLLLVLIARASLTCATRAPNNCVEAILLLDTCLASFSLVGLTDEAQSVPSDRCCDAIKAVMESTPLCTCHLVVDPTILGFLINSTRVLELPALCGQPPLSCDGSQSLPPLRTPSDSESTNETDHLHASSPSPSESDFRPSSKPYSPPPEFGPQLTRSQSCLFSPSAIFLLLPALFF